jgi:hypothetical protein
MDLEYVKLENDDDEILFYEAQAKRIKDMEDKTLMINIEHIIEFDSSGELIEPIISEYPRYLYLNFNLFYFKSRFESYINQAVQDFMISVHKEWAMQRKFWVGLYNISYLAK